MKQDAPFARSNRWVVTQDNMMIPDTPTSPTGHKELVLQGRYRVTRSLGSGGMGDVYLAEDLRLQRLVAIKSLRREFCKMEEVRKRIERECVMHAQIGAHPNIITLYDRIEEEGQIHLVIEYVNGSTLKDYMDRARSGEFCLSWRESVSIACQILDALAKIHGHDIVHRDVKPANVMLVENETGGYTAKLMDFGIARLMNPVDGATMLTREGSAGPGTPIYMSPEQIAGTQFGPLSPASDIYAMGVVLYQMLTGRPPYQGTITDIFHGHLNAPPPDPAQYMDATYPAALTEVLHKSLRKHPGDRYASAAEFRYWLRRVAKAQGVNTSLALNETVPPGALQSQSNATVQLTPIPSETPVAGAGMLNRRSEGARSTRNFVAIVGLIVAAVAIAVVGNFYFFRSMVQSPAETTPPPQPAIDGAPVVPQPTPPAPAAQTPAPAPPAPAPSPTPTPAPAPVPVQTPPTNVVQPPAPPVTPMPESPAADQPAPVTLTPEAETKPAPKPKPKPKPRPESGELTPEEEQAPIEPQARKIEPERTPVPQQTPVPSVDLDVHPQRRQTPIPGQPYSAPYVSPPTGSTTPPPDANVFQDMQVNKKPAVKVY